MDDQFRDATKKMDDTIYRRDAIETVSKALKGTFVEYQEIAEKMINKIPSAQPERKKGEWIVTSEFEDCRYVKCNQCKVTQVFYYNKPLTNFCPNCGAKMEGKND